jgi:hypothetical protein
MELVAAVHLVGLTTVARNHQNLININGRLLINFTKWVKLNARMKEIFEYKSPNYVNGRELKSFAYLEGELWRVNANTDLNESLEARSNLLEAEERGTHKFRRPF